MDPKQSARFQGSPAGMTKNAKGDTQFWKRPKERAAPTVGGGGGEGGGGPLPITSGPSRSRPKKHADSCVTHRARLGGTKKRNDARNWAPCPVDLEHWEGCPANEVLRPASNHVFFLHRGFQAPPDTALVLIRDPSELMKNSLCSGKDT